jgi:2-polyprenyl-6-methoxyphenol hydroxylase-like FAD-dependent oxidoreductase
MPHYHVGITGFGIAGGALAILLARAGHKVTLIERALQVGPVGAGFLLQPSGQRVLKRIGLLENIAAQSEPLHGLHAFKASGGTLVHLRYKGAGPNLHAYGVHRGLLFETLHQAVLRENVPLPRRVLNSGRLTCWSPPTVPALPCAGHSTLRSLFTNMTMALSGR